MLGAVRLRSCRGCLVAVQAAEWGPRGPRTSMLRSSSYSGNYARDEPSFAAVLISQTFHAIEHALVGSAIFRYIGAVPVQLKLGLSNARR